MEGNFFSIVFIVGDGKREEMKRRDMRRETEETEFSSLCLDGKEIQSFFFSYFFFHFILLILSLKLGAK